MSTKSMCLALAFVAAGALTGLAAGGPFFDIFQEPQDRCTVHQY